MKPFALKALIFVVSFWLGCFVVNRVLNRAFIQDRSHKQMWSLSLRDLSMDYAIVGSSRALNNVDALALSSKTGSHVVNLGCGGQSIMDMYLTLYLFLKHNNRVHDVLLQVDGTDVDYSHQFMSYIYVPYLSDAQVAATESEMGGFKRRIARTVCPLSAYWEYNDFYDLQRLRQIRSEKSEYDATQGSQLLYDDSYNVFPVIEEQPRFVADARSVKYLERLMKLAVDHGVRVTVFSAPQYHRDPIFRRYDNDARSYIAQFCRDHGVRYLDFTEAQFDSSEFRDYGHLNGRGAERFSLMLSDSLNNMNAVNSAPLASAQ